MSPLWIEIDDEVLALIKEKAEPFLDSPNDVVRRVFGLQAGARPTCSPLPSARPPRRAEDRPTQRRARAGDLLPLAEYELPLLRALFQLGGSAPRWQVTDAVEGMLAQRLTDLDREPLQSGEVRWCNRLGFARLRAIDRGHLRPDSRRGVWELAEAGIERLRQLEAGAQKREREVPQ